MVIDYFNKIIDRKVPKIQKTIGVHIRFGDYKGTASETNIDYYLNIINLIKNKYGNRYKFNLFSDAKDSELTIILNNSSAEKVFFGDALSDMLALSKCDLIIGSDSTFGAMAAFLGNTSIIFPKRHFGSVLNDSTKELVFNDFKSNNILESFLSRVLK
jgi:ADP-heptose:LPS heptosyltransferase